MEDAVEEARIALIESVAETDEDLMELYFEEGTLPEESLVAGLRKAVSEGEVTPLVCGSALHNMAIDRLLDFLVSSTPSAIDRGELSDRVRRDPDRRERTPCHVRLEDEFGRILGEGHLFSRRLRRARDRCPRLQPFPQGPGEVRAGERQSGQGADERRGDPCGGHRRRRQAEGHGLQATASESRRTRSSSRRPVCRIPRFPMQSSPRRARTRTVSAAPSRACSRRTRR